MMILSCIFCFIVLCLNAQLWLFYNASIHTATLKVIDTVLIPTGILCLSSLLKLSILFAHFLHASNVTLMIISSHLSHYEKTCHGLLKLSGKLQNIA